MGRDNVTNVEIVHLSQTLGRLLERGIAVLFLPGTAPYCFRMMVLRDQEAKGSPAAPSDDSPVQRRNQQAKKTANGLPVHSF